MIFDKIFLGRSAAKRFQQNTIKPAAFRLAPTATSSRLDLVTSSRQPSSFVRPHSAPPTSDGTTTSSPNKSRSSAAQRRRQPFTRTLSFEHQPSRKVDVQQPLRNRKPVAKHQTTTVRDDLDYYDDDGPTKVMEPSKSTKV